MNYRLRKLAIHEAGHATVALHFNLEPAIRGKTVAGGRKGFAAGTTCNCADTIRQKLTLLVAGAAACHLFSGGVCLDGADDDFRKFDALCRKQKIEPSCRAPYAIGVFSDAVRILESRKDEVLAIAEALYERRELSCDDIRLVVANAVGVEAEPLARELAEIGRHGHDGEN